MGTAIKAAMNRINTLSPPKKGLIAFGISFVLLLLFVSLKDITRFYWDANHYWDSSRGFFDNENNSFSFVNERLWVRGYLFPLILFIVRGVGLVLPLGPLGEIYAFRLFASAFFAFMLTIALPYFFTLISKREIGIISRVIVVCLTAFFFPGLLLHPLSDFYAFSFVLCALSLLLYINTCQNDSKLQYIVMFTIGLLLYCAYNTRLVYILAAALTAVLGIIVTWKKRGLGFACIFTVLLACGWMLAALPQMMINDNLHGTLSFGVDTRVEDYTDGVLVYSLNEGINTQYYLGSLDEAYHGGLRFLDPMGMQVQEVEGSYIKDVGSYTKLVLQYPLEFIGIYTRHLINLLNPIDGEVYVFNLQKIKIHYTLLNYILMFATVLCLVGGKHYSTHGEITKGKVRRNHPRALVFLYLLPLIITCVVALHAAPESRFFLPLYILMYAYLAFVADWKALWSLVKRRYAVVAVSFFAVLFVFIAIWSNTYANADGVTLFMR